MTIPKLSKRLRRAGDFVRKGSFLADVGTDHAYLPIALMAEGTIRGAVVSDIHRGPIERATQHICEYGMENKLIPLLTDGLRGLEPYAPEDILILGMGGELIVRILGDAPFTQKEGIRLILQPMTHPECVREFLSQNGYEIVEEALVSEDKLYQIIVAEYTGRNTEYSEVQLWFGPQNLNRGDALTQELLAHWEQVLQKRKQGKEMALQDTAQEDALLQQIGEWKK